MSVSMIVGILTVDKLKAKLMVCLIEVVIDRKQRNIG